MRDVTTDAPPRPAATVVLLRPGADGPEVLLTLRPASMAFAADLYVFPGGRGRRGRRRSAARGTVRPVAGRCVGGARRRSPRRRRPGPVHGRDPRAVRGGGRAARGAGARAAARRRRRARERAERRPSRRSPTSPRRSISALRTDLLVPISHWTTPPIMPRRFDTRFFAAELPAGAEATFPGRRGRGAPLGDAARRARGDGRGRDRDVGPDERDAPAARARPRRSTRSRQRLAPRLRRRAARHRGAAGSPRGSSSSGAGGVPGQTVNTYLVGRDEVVIVDPGRPVGRGGPARSSTRSPASGGRLVAHRPDPRRSGPRRRRGGARAPARRSRSSPGPGAGATLPYLVRELGDGERIAVAGDARSTVVATPGPRAGPPRVRRREAPVLAGDLVGGRGDRAILGPPDAAAWAASLARLAALRPDRVYPGHGDPLGPERARGQAGSDAARFRSRLRPSSTSFGRCVRARHEEARPARQRDARELAPLLVELAAGGRLRGPLVDEDDRRRPPDRDLLPERPDPGPERRVGRLVAGGRLLVEVGDPVARGDERVVGGRRSPCRRAGSSPG